VTRYWRAQAAWVPRREGRSTWPQSSARPRSSRSWRRSWARALRSGRASSRVFLVAYCRGPYCVLAVEAVSLLRKKGFKATRLGDGILDWAAMGHRLEVSGTK
jgi:hypothetical protein